MKAATQLTSSSPATGLPVVAPSPATPIPEAATREPFNSLLHQALAEPSDKGTRRASFSKEPNEARLPQPGPAPTLVQDSSGTGLETLAGIPGDEAAESELKEDKPEESAAPPKRKRAQPKPVGSGDGPGSDIPGAELLLATLNSTSVPDQTRCCAADTSHEAGQEPATASGAVSAASGLADFASNQPQSCRNGTVEKADPAVSAEADLAVALTPQSASPETSLKKVETTQLAQWKIDANDPSSSTQSLLSCAPKLETADSLADGTASAQPDCQMKNCPTQNEIAALTVDLPPEVSLTRGALKNGVLRFESSKTGEKVNEFLPVANAMRADEVSAPAAEPEAPRALTSSRLFESIVHEVAIVRRLRPESLAVVLKPDERTEILLRLEQRDGRLEAAVRCERGDYQALNAHWPELQRCLQHQGVRLLDLQPGKDGLAAAGGETGGSFQQGSQRYHEFESAAGSATTAPPRHHGVTAGHRTRKGFASQRLLESWA